MRCPLRALFWIFFLASVKTTLSPSPLPAQAPLPISEITPPEADSGIPDFYKQLITVDGYQIVASDRVSPFALKEAAYWVAAMMRHRPDVLASMRASGSRMSIIAWNEFTTDLPEWKWLGSPEQDGAEAPGVSARDYWDGRARGMGGSQTDPYCSCGEENLLAYPDDPYAAECILIHEFAHNIHLRGMNQIDPTFDTRVEKVYREAIGKGLWKGTYAAVNHHEYFAEGVQSWFDNNRHDDHDHNHVDTRKELLQYDPGLAELCREVFGPTELIYTKPATRLSGHLEGFLPEQSPTFRWPLRVETARKAIRQQVTERNQRAGTPPITQWTAEQIFSAPELQEKGPGQIAWHRSGEIAYRMPPGDGDTAIERCDPKLGRFAPWISRKQLIPQDATAPLAVESFATSDDESKLLLYTNSQRVWRYNTRGDYWLLDRSSGALRKLGGDDQSPASMMFAKFSPDSKHVAFVRNQDLYVEDLATGSIRQLTFGGMDGKIHGTGDWVYEEELDLRDGYRWSPDGRHIAFWEIDTSEVGIFHLIDNTTDRYARLIPIPYPKAGQTNPSCRIGVVSLDDGQIDWIELPGDPRNHYIAHAQWNPSNQRLYLQRFNRLQNQNEVFDWEPATKQPRLLWTDRDAAWLENENPFRWIDGGKNFLWLSERIGWRGLYRVSAEHPDQATPILEAPWDVIEIISFDPAGNSALVSASPSHATQKYLYRVDLQNGSSERVTPIDQTGWHTYQTVPGSPWALHSWSSAGKPASHEWLELEGHQRLQLLEDNAELSALVTSLALPTPIFRTIEIEPGVSLDGWLLEPPAPQEDGPQQPLLVHVYGEPHGQTVRDAWWGRQGLWHRWLASRGMFVASFDNRGTKVPKGRTWRKSVHRQIGVLAAEDQAKAVGRLLKEVPRIDPSRIAVWGWSGGGSMSLHGLFRFPELYRAAISVAPVPDQTLYDTIYQERYMGLPQENPEGYRAGSPITYADRMEGNLLLIHGTGDDNCHYQGVERLMDRLIAHGKLFQVLPYPNRSHSISEGDNTTPHLYSSMTRFLQEQLRPETTSGP